jgi:predicted O-methyltransferase YrrM
MMAKRILVAAIAVALAGCASIESSPMARDDEEKQILGVLEEMAENEGRGMDNASPEEGRLLRLLTEATDAKHVVEIGTSNGYSGIWFCLALRTTGGRLTTHEIDAERAALARKNFERAGVARMVTLVEGDAHEEVIKLKGPIDLLFLDADKSGYLDYLEKLLPLVRPGALVLADNMQPLIADPKYVEAITSNPDLETIFLHKSLWGGVGVTMKKRHLRSPSGEAASAIGP